MNENTLLHTHNIRLASLLTPYTHVSTHDTLETMDVSLAPSYNLHIANTGDSSYLRYDLSLYRSYYLYY